MKRAHERQLQDFQRHFKALASVERRERQSLAIELKREEFNTLGLKRSRQKIRAKDRGGRTPDGPHIPFGPSVKPDKAPPEPKKISKELADALKERAKEKKKKRERNQDRGRSRDDD